MVACIVGMTPAPKGHMAIHIRRREFVAALGSAAAWPCVVRAQQRSKQPTIGYLGPTVNDARTAAFADRLRELGWINGRTVAIEYRYSEGHPERVAEIAAEFVRQKVDVIVTYGGAVATVKQATATIPIVFAMATDPVRVGLVASLSRPGGNVTGISVQQAESAGKRVELLREVVPRLQRLAIMSDGGYSAAMLESNAAQEAARTLGLEVMAHEIGHAEDIASAFEALNGGADALYVVGDTLTYVNRFRINTLALAARLPTVYDNRDFVEAEGLMSYGPNFPDLHRRAAEFVDKILRGTKPGDIPVEEPTKFDLVINPKTAKALGLTFPDKLLALADEVIE
jgi:putative tryptophan/tyrosine transport system substrate-binding protein